MITLLIALATAILGLAAGVLWRELYELLKRIKAAVIVLKTAQDKHEQQSKKMTFADPLNFDELDDEEKIQYLNS